MRCGTYLHAPASAWASGRTVAELKVGCFLYWCFALNGGSKCQVRVACILAFQAHELCCPLVVIDVTHKTQGHEACELGMDDIMAWERNSGRIPEGMAWLDWPEHLMPPHNTRLHA